MIFVNQGVSFLSLTLDTAADNLALDEALLLAAEEGAGGEILRLWEWRHPAVVLGAGCKLAENVVESACQEDGCPILRRPSGGGTVLLGPGCLCYSLVLGQDREPGLRGIRSSYRVILERICAALAGRVPRLSHEGISDLAIAKRKCSGSAQQRKSRFLLHHGTLLYDFDCARAGRYLRMPPCQPEYRARRDHADFLVNMPIVLEELTQLLRDAWQARAVATDVPLDRVRKMVAEKYLDQAWIRRR